MVGIVPDWSRFFFDLPVVNNQSQGSRSGFSNQETGTAVMRVITVLIFLHEASIHTLLYLTLNFLTLFLRSGVGTASHPRFLKLGFEFQVHLDQFFALKRGRQGDEHLLIG